MLARICMYRSERFPETWSDWLFQLWSTGWLLAASLGTPGVLRVRARNLSSKWIERSRSDSRVTVTSLHGTRWARWSWLLRARLCPLCRDTQSGLPRIIARDLMLRARRLLLVTIHNNEETPYILFVYNVPFSHLALQLNRTNSSEPRGQTLSH